MKLAVACVVWNCRIVAYGVAGTALSVIVFVRAFVVNLPRFVVWKLPSLVNNLIVILSQSRYGLLLELLDNIFL